MILDLLKSEEKMEIVKKQVGFQQKLIINVSSYCMAHAITNQDLEF